MLIQIFIALFAASLLISQSAMDVSAGLLSLILLWTGYRWKEQQSVRRLFNSIGWDWIFLLWFASILLSYAVNGFPGDDWYMHFLNDIKWILVFYFLVAALRYQEPSESVRPWVAGVFALCSFYAIVIWFLGMDPIRPDEPLQTLPGGMLRTGGFLAQPIVFAHLYQLPLCLLFAQWMTMVRWREKGAWLLGVSVALGALAILLSFSRGVWISLAAAIIVMTFLFSRRLAIGAVLFGAVAFTALYTSWPDFHDRVQYAVHGGDAERVWIWKANIEMFKEHPITGIGYGENVKALGSYYEKVGAPKDLMQEAHAHNQYIHMLAGTGVVGTAAYLLMMLYFLVLAFRVWYRISSRDGFHKGITLGLIGAQVAFLVGGLTEANLEHSKMRYTLLFVWALTVWMAYEYRVIRERV